MEKEVKLANERSVRVIVDNEELLPKINITECFCEDSLECAHYSLEQGDKFCFAASLDMDLQSEENNKTLVFNFNVDHPLYFPLLHLLGKDKEVIIKDDEVEDAEQKCLVIVNDNDLITMSFVDKTKASIVSGKFVVTCDTKFDYLTNLSAVKNNDTKKRLYYFFHEASEVLLEDSHQISMEEYDVHKKVLEKEKLRASS